MTILEAIFLGIIQGATEFLPISSSGHTVLLPEIFNMPSPSLALISIAHLGTLVAVLIYFRRDLWRIIRSVFVGLLQRRPLAEPDARLGWYILVGSIPAAVAGLLFADFFEEVFAQPIYAAFFLLVTAGLLVVGERLLTGGKELDQIGWQDGLIVGVFQMLALFPGISRSGSTITGGLARGMNRETAARFSFLLGVPAILGAGLLAIIDIAGAGLEGQWPVFVTTFLAAAISGYACIYFLLAWLRSHSLYIFAIYTAAFGSLYLLFTFL